MNKVVLTIYSPIMWSMFTDGVPESEWVSQSDSVPFIVFYTHVQKSGHSGMSPNCLKVSLSKPVVASSWA